jgi:dolichol-phosphate mannosyltransferase
VSLSVLVPALNEEKGLEATVLQLLGMASGMGHDFEIIVVDDGSSDATATIARRLSGHDPRVRLLQNERNMGLGYSYLRGVREARKTHFVYIPGDNSWPPDSVAEIFRHLGKADVVTSYATNPEVRVGYRRVLSSLYTTIVNALFGLRMRYYNGLTIYPMDVLRANLPTTHGFGFQAETLLKALYAGASVVEVAVAIDETAAQASKAITVRNIVSVVDTVGRTFVALRLRRRHRERAATAS